MILRDGVTTPGDVEWALDLEGFRRATPVHDPDFMLWLDA